MEKFKTIVSTLFSFDKRMIIISVSCIFAGCLATGIGFALVDYDIYKLDPNPDIEYQDIKKDFALQDIENIEIDVDHVDVIVERMDGSEFQLEYAESEDKPIKIDSTSKKLSIKHQRKIRLFQFNWMNFSEEDTVVKLQIPKDYVGNLMVSNRYGSIDLSDLKGLKDVSIENDHGNINVNTMEALTISLSNAYGIIKADHLVSGSDIEIDNHHDDTDLRDIKAKNFHADSRYGMILIDTMKLENACTIYNDHDNVDFVNVQSKVSQIDVSYGEVVMKDWISDDITIDVDHGNVTSDVLGKESDYHIISDVEHGESNLAKERNKDKDKKFNISLSYGDVEVNFKE